MAAAPTDVWGDAAMRQPDGPSYEFFADLLPPIRYVNTDFRHYPIVLSGPQAHVKARLVSNGSAINAVANKFSWREAGFPVTFKVGSADETFGADFERIDGPRYADGWLPIVQIAYDHKGTVYRQESFAAVEPELASHGAVLMRFESSGDTPGRVRAEIKADGPLKTLDGAL